MHLLPTLDDVFRGSRHDVSSETHCHGRVNRRASTSGHGPPSRPHLLFYSPSPRVPRRACPRFVPALSHNTCALLSPLENHDTSPAPQRNPSMSIFSQLVSAITGYGAEPANDVRPLFSPLLHGLSDRFKNLTTDPTVVPPHTADVMPHQTDDGVTWSLAGPETLPSNPFASKSPTTRTFSPGDRIDLTSPTRQAPPERRKRREDTDLRRPPLRNNRSADERRLIADYE